MAGDKSKIGGARADVVAAIVGFARTLRHAGVAATPDRVATMLTAVEALGGSTAAVYWAGRQSLCAEPDDLPVYDAAFRAYFGGARPFRGHGLPVTPVLPSVAAPFTGGPPQAAEESDDIPEVLALSASPVEVLRQRDFALLTAGERDEVRRLVALLGPGTAPRRTRRRKPARGAGEVDPRRTVRRLLRHAGEPSRLDRRRRRDKPRRLVLLLDVSGSMTPYADALLRFAHAAVRRRPTLTEVFTVGTRLTRVTRPLRHRDADAALAAASSAIPDWHGGTRLADSLRAFVDRWGRRGTARGAIVVVCSDGWERGTPEALATQLDRLSRLAYRIVWVNPHRGKQGYAPLAGGMAAVLPYLDDFVAGHSLSALEELVTVLGRS